MHLLILIVCVISVEIFIRLSFTSFFFSILKITKKVVNVIPQKNISDHWKEKVIPVYAFRIMKYSAQILSILLLLICFFFVVDYFFNGFLDFAFSFIGVAESMVFAYGYFHIRKYVIR